MRRVVDLPAGEAKTDARDAAIIAEAALSMPHTLRSLRRFRCLNVVDGYTRECLAIEVNTSLPGLRVKQVLEWLQEMRGLPASITVDNGPEFAGKVSDAWACEAGATLSFIRPGKPRASTAGSATND